MARIFKDKLNEYLNGIHRDREKAWDIIKQVSLGNTTKDKADRIIETLQEHSRHVAWIRAKGKDSGTWRSGTFFLLTKSIGLTSYNAVKDIWKSWNDIIEIRFVHTHIGADGLYLQAKVVESDEKLNFAYLQIISRYPGCPGGLLRHLALPPKYGSVTIIGHPEDQVKQIHVCSVLNFEHVSDPSFVDVLPLYRSRKLLSSESITNEARLYEEASGAPMFNDRGELVAMHSGSYTLDASATTKTFIEYGRSMVEIIIMGAVIIDDLRCEFFKLVQSNKDLRSYIYSDSHPTHMKDVITKLKELWKREIKVDHPKDVLPLKFTIEFTINNEEDLNNVLQNCDNYNSQRTSILSHYLSPTLYSEKPPEPPDSRTRGCYKCHSGTCKVCKYMKEGSSFISYKTKKTYHMYQSINCNSTYVVYVISCTECGLQYVGITERKLEKRIWEHITDAEKKVLEIMYEHFINKHPGKEKHFTFQGIQMIENPTKSKDSKKLLEYLEKVWIWRLQTDELNGLNKRRGSINLHI